MLIVVDPHSGVPVYRQLMDQVKFHIASGLLRPGDALPSTRALSAELGINPMTISKAYSFLEAEGIIERRPGRPLVVAALEHKQVHDRKIDQLSKSLEPVVTVIKQLRIDHEEAVRLFETMLHERASDNGRDEGEI
jgi:GntR family transcriptional regulator